MGGFQDICGVTWLASWAESQCNIIHLWQEEHRTTISLLLLTEPKHNIALTSNIKWQTVNDFKAITLTNIFPTSVFKYLFDFSRFKHVLRINLRAFPEALCRYNIYCISIIRSKIQVFPPSRYHSIYNTSGKKVGMNLDRAKILRLLLRSDWWFANFQMFRKKSLGEFLNISVPGHKLP